MSSVEVAQDDSQAMCVRSVDNAGTEHRHWFEKTDKNRLVLGQEVLQHDETRECVPHYEMMVPPRVEDELEDMGYTVVNNHGAL